MWLQPVQKGQHVGVPRLLAPDLGRIVQTFGLTRSGAFMFFVRSGRLMSMWSISMSMGFLSGDRRTSDRVVSARTSCQRGRRMGSSWPTSRERWV